MAFQLSPGINVSEVDLTTYVPSVATTIGAFAGVFNWGPANEIVTIDQESTLIDRFGKPTSNNATYWFSASNFLAYGNTLRVVRAVSNTTTFNATANGTGILIANETDYLQNQSTGAANNTFAAKYAGALGNGIVVKVADANTYNSAFTATERGFFTDSPSTSDFAFERGASNDELHILVIDTTGKISGVANTVIEKFGFVSKASDAKLPDGTSNYYKNVINNRSKYVWWLGHTTAVSNTGLQLGAITVSGAFANLTGNVTATLSGGADGTIETGALQQAYDQFKNGDNIDVSLIFTGPANTTVSKYVIDNIAEVRKDCVVFVSPAFESVVDNYGGEAVAVKNDASSIGSSSYAFMDSGWKYQYDKFNDVYRWIPLNGDIAGLTARSDQTRDPWYSPAGVNRGVVKNVIKLAWNPSKANRDDIYSKGINPVVTFSGEGTILYGDKTLLSRPSAFDRINVRRLFIVLQKAISVASRSTLFEFNDQFTRAQFVALVEPYLRDVQGRRGIFDFRVVCDESNNTPEVIDRNEFVGDIYIKPARSVNFIQLNFVAVRTGVDFTEIVGRF